MINFVSVVPLVLVVVALRQAIKSLRRNPVCPLTEDQRLMSVRKRIVDCLKKSPEWKKDVANLRQASKAFRRFVNSTIPHVNTNRIASAGGSINDLLAFPDMSSLEVDFGKINGDPETCIVILNRFHELRSLSLSNVHLAAAVTERMCTLTGLRRLSFQRCNFTALNFLSDLKSLTQLHFYEVNVVQPSLECLTELTELKFLTVDYCDELLQNNIHWIARSFFIRNVSLTPWKFTKDDLLNLSSLNADLALSIHGLYFQGGFSSLLSLPTLKILSLKTCDLETLQFPIAELRALKHLSLSAENVSASCVTDLLVIQSQLHSLSLELTNTDKITLGTICRTGFPLVSLSFSMKVLEVDESLGLCTNLEALTIRGTQELFFSETLTSLRSLTKLKQLTIVGCANWAPILQVLPDSGVNLESLVMDGGSFSEEDLQVIAQKASLQSLAFIHCEILSYLEPLTKIPSLQDLTVDCCLSNQSHFAQRTKQAFFNRVPHFVFKTE